MKFASKIGLAAVAALVLAAVLGTASASAYSTVLCKEYQQAPYCKASDRYPKNTAISASSSSVVAETTIGNMTCGESTITGKTSAESGEPLPVSITAWTLGNCNFVGKSGSKTCTVTANESAPYSGSLNRTSVNNGTLNIGSGGSGNPGWTVKCGFYISCTYTIEPGFTYNGLGGSAAMSATKVPLAKGSGVCPESATLTGTYTVSSPQPARLAVPKEAPTEPATALCKSLDNNYYCEPGDLYKSGTTFKGEPTKAVFTKIGGVYGDLSCGESSLTASTTADYGEPLPLNAEFSFSNCAFINGTACQVVANGTKAGGISRENNGGAWTGDGVWSGLSAVSFDVKCGFLLHCVYAPVSSSTFKLVHGESSGAIAVNEIELKRVEGPCSESGKLVGEYSLSTPGPLAVLDAFR